METVVVVRLKSPLELERGAFGLRVPVEMWGREWVIEVPDAVWVDGSRGRLPIVKPLSPGIADETSLDDLGHLGDWGWIEAFERGTDMFSVGVVRTVQLRLVDPSGDDLLPAADADRSGGSQAGEGAAETSRPVAVVAKGPNRVRDSRIGEVLAANVDRWKEQVALWTSVVSSQWTGEGILAVDHRRLCDGVWVHYLSGDGEPVEVAALGTSLFEQHQPPVSPLDADQLTFVLRSACSDVELPLSYVLHREATNQLHLRDTRRAVLDAATSSELVLSAVLDAELSELDPALAAAMGRGALNRLANLLRHRDLPTGLEAHLIEIRNRIIHRGFFPSAAEAERAVAVSREVLVRFEPLAQ